MAGSRLRTLAVSAIVAALLLVATRQLTLDAAHAPHSYYRAQVDAFLDGRLALTPHPEGLAHDLAWTPTGVQQVWGLGVPAWQTPFELAGRALGVSPVPDRIAMVAWLALAIFALWRGFRRRGREPWWVGPGTVLIAALLPGFVAMLRGKLGVYEEAALYAYGAALMLLGGLACFIRRPTAAGYILLVGLAGLGGLIRPTVWFWGAATLVVATVAWIGQTRSPGARLRRLAAPILLGAALFVAGGALLYATNEHRFGRGTEFGHRLNLHSLPGNLMATRFGYPFERASLSAAAEELAGSLFDRPEHRSKRGFYQIGIHRGQQPIPRWREYYFSTYSWPYAPLLALGLLLALLAWRRRSDLDRTARWLGPWALLGTAPLVAFYLWSPSLSSRYQLDLAPGVVALLAITWRAFAGYARAGIAIPLLLAAWGGAVATSKVTRPRIGGGPVDANTAASAYRISRPLTSPRTLPAGHDADDLAFGLHSDIATSFARCADFGGVPVPCDAPPLPGDRRVVGARDDAGWLVTYVRIPDDQLGEAGQPGELEPPLCSAPEPEDLADPADPADLRCDTPPTIATSPDAVVEATAATPTPLYLDAFGWDLETRRVPVATYFFADAPRFVELEVEYAPQVTAFTRPIADWSAVVRVAVGLAHLSLSPVHAVDTARGVRLRFEPPAPLPSGLQVIFVAFGLDEHLAWPRSDFKLHAIRWR